MRTSLESLLADSLNGLKDLSQSVADNTELEGPVEGLTAVTSEQIAAEVTAHMQDERYNDPSVLSDDCRAFCEQNEAEHAAMRSEINEVKEMVGGVVSSMEMLSVIASMESVTDHDLSIANAAVGNIASQYGADLPPVLQAEDGSITTASMEGLVDWVKKALIVMKKWIAEKFANMTMNQRRMFRTRVNLLDRAEAVRRRIESLPDDYGIPAKQMRYDPKALYALFQDGKLLTLDEPSLNAATQEVNSIMNFANQSIGKDAVKRSDLIAGMITDILVARDEISAEEKLRSIFKDVTQPLPVETYLNEQKLRDREMIGGMTFQDPARSYRGNYRDAEWIMDLARLVDMNQAMVKFRLVGPTPSTVYDVPQLQLMLNAVGDILDGGGMEDTAYYEDLSSAWQEANKVYQRMFHMVSTMEFPHMNNELWRALDVGVTSMFLFLDKGYKHTLILRKPAYRLADALLYMVEEQMKQYVAVNR